MMTRIRQELNSYQQILNNVWTENILRQKIKRFFLTCRLFTTQYYIDKVIDKLMCIVATSVGEVSSTKIVSFHVGYVMEGYTEPTESQNINPTPAQLIIYSAKVENKALTNAFILPVYNPGNDSNKIIPVSLQNLPNIIEDIDNVFSRWYPQPKLLSASYSNSFGDGPASNKLEVFYVDDYKFSIMPRGYDFKRLDQTKLNISQEATIAIDQHSLDYSFIVCQFDKPGKIEVKPFGYLCPAHTSESMIIPTIHGHPHDFFGMNVGMGYIQNMFVNYKSNFEDKSHFDHEIYALIKTSDETQMVTKSTHTDVVDLDRIIRKIKTDYMFRPLRIYVPKNFYPKKISLHNKLPNRNLYIDVNKENFLNDLSIDMGVLGNVNGSM
jgi:hypothetical protein